MQIETEASGVKSADGSGVESADGMEASGIESADRNGSCQSGEGEVERDAP